MDKELSEKQKEEMFKEFIKVRDDFLLETEHDNLLIIILKAHMFIEQELYKIIEKVMVNPEALKLKYLSEKLQLVYALGLVEKDAYASLTKLNDIRNSYAHNLNFQMGERELDYLKSPLSKKSLKEFHGTLPEGIKFKNLDFISKVRMILSYLCSTIVIERLLSTFTMIERSMDLQLKDLEILQNFITSNSDAND
ncbi:hypothetical protein [Planomicrobium sp. YIM 101495]|uniref:hypothetical protein n=1 Tax=Planomicrobium sp. YIM 101495 TaxID=2665160 RepID=UPI0012B6F369|nr:hypothetical protein [Planomicrobium sp. YIM 101495]MTD30148.1 hypothetical protein [Planomicrobium sp. YIM 101495]